MFNATKLPSPLTAISENTRAVVQVDYSPLPFLFSHEDGHSRLHNVHFLSRFIPTPGRNPYQLPTSRLRRASMCVLLTGCGDVTLGVLLLAFCAVCSHLSLLSLFFAVRPQRIDSEEDWGLVWSDENRTTSATSSQCCFPLFVVLVMTLSP